jgi:phosphoribosylamine--glycine ligase
LESDIVDAFMGVACNQDFELKWSKKAALGIVMATKGYPGAYQKGFPIHNLEAQETSIFHMGTQNIKGEICTNGGRVLFVTALADSLKEAQEKALNQVQQIQCDQLFYRKDIGWQVL